MKRKNKRKLISIGSTVLIALFFLTNRNSKHFILYPADPAITGYEEPIQKKNNKYKK